MTDSENRNNEYLLVVRLVDTFCLIRVINCELRLLLENTTFAVILRTRKFRYSQITLLTCP